MLTEGRGAVITPADGIVALTETDGGKGTPPHKLHVWQGNNRYSTTNSPYLGAA